MFFASLIYISSLCNALPHSHLIINNNLQIHTCLGVVFLLLLYFVQLLSITYNFHCVQLFDTSRSLVRCTFFFFSALPPDSVFVPPPPLWDICVMRVTCHSLCTLLEEKVCIFFLLFACFAQLHQSTARAWLRHETRPNNNSFPFSYKVTKSS